MICNNPVIVAGRPFGCGQCMPCRFNRRRVWAHRIELEAMQYGDNAFVTLTYCDEDLPAGGTLVPKHLQDWLKRVRRGYERRIRFFAVGEYGDVSERPHYHAALFNYPSCRYGMSTYTSRRLRCCAACDFIASTWPFGNIFLGTLEARSAGYIAGYVTKKMTDKSDPRLAGRHPEFARMSLKPGIGGDICYDVASTVIQYDLEAPTALAHGGKDKPLGRYLSGRVRAFSGKEGSDEALSKIDAEMLPLRLGAKASAEEPGLKSRVLAVNEGKRNRFEAKQRIFKKRRVL